MSISSPLPPSVLFVDDEDKARKYFALAMTSDFDVKTAASATEALAILEEFADRIAIVVSDQRMPETTGVELLKIVRERYPHIVRLLTTAYTELEDAIAAINRGEILRYIQKPWDVGTLKAELKHAMNYFQLRSERDKLLEEKLSVKRSMMQIERISQLLLVAEAIPHLRFTGQAVHRYIDQLSAFKDAAADAGDIPMLDLWSQTLAETARMKRFIRKVVDELSIHLPAGTEFDTQIELPALSNLLLESAGEASPALELQILEDAQMPAGGICIAGPLFRLMLVKLLAVIQSRNVTTVSVRLSATGKAPHSGLQLVFGIPETDFAPLHGILSGPVSREIPPSCADLLLVFLACIHHGGSLDIHAKRGDGIILNLPTNPLDAALPTETPDFWHENILMTFEPTIY